MTGGFTPSSDYYFLVAWKRVVGARVLDMGALNAGEDVRVYGFCEAGGGGAVALVALNLKNESRCVAWAAFSGAGGVEQYAFTAGDDAGVESYAVRLNGALLALGPGGALPSMAGVPAAVENATVALPPQSVTLLVVPGAAPAACT